MSGTSTPPAPPSGATVSLTETAALTILRAVLLLVLPPGTEVVAGQDNRVPEPTADNFVVVTPTGRTRLGWNYDSYADVPGAGQWLATQPTEFTVQIDVHGPAGAANDASAENAQIISTLLRGGWAALQMAALNPDVQPLYTSEPRQMPFTNGEDQTETRWIVDVTLQLNVTVGVPQQFAGTITVTPTPADLTAILEGTP